MFLQGYLPSILQGAVLTLQLAGSALLVSIVLGLIGALFKSAHSKLLVWLAELYSTVVRGVPDLVWMFLLFFGVQMMINDFCGRMGWESPNIDPFVAGVLTLGFIFGAYMTETFRGAMMAVPKGQMEAGMAYGMTPLRVFFRITVPQMVRFALPSFSNNWLVLVKSTALVSVIGLNDVMYRADAAKSTTQEPFTVYLIVGLLFLAITGVSNLLLGKLEKRYSLGVKESGL
ncbi:MULTISPECIES: ABC transporter permease [Chromobacterium]|uniref:ABC transporter n=2 Tax=Chromobacterium TaxID=535 RepID=A0A1W0CMJ4_9NEIS|nr:MULTISPECIES: ABC transporter permease [Chromobacterium]AXT45649.1 ABC transporter permease [Chromobacterium rhizoryzae]MBK0416762.1 ABC transporter permease [Chromobacterium haemolyticum]MBO0417896.1 ABC transporter permease [Chromobacterium haemolyticum]MBO0501149.1 ABC transporter permease [Chromobacterium haemolyticum]MDH0343619.1 ABC transporter permease [Chromobacterium haemolyticum]